MKTIKKLYPHAIAVVFFILLSYAYFSPLLEGKSIQQSDVSQWKGMSKEIRDYREKTGEEPLWTNRLFGGMPSFFISTQYPNNYVRYLDNLLMVGERPASILFLCLLGFYFALLLLGVNPWLSMVGALAYGFTSYFFTILSAGHNTKAISIAYMAPVIASVIYTYRKKLLLGMALTGIFLSLLVLARHPQIAYYGLITVVIFGIVELIYAIREKRVVKFLKITGFLFIPLFLAVGSNSSNLWTKYEYGKYSMRGKSELEIDKENQTSGLDKDYATRWSYGLDETLTLLVPNYKGGSSRGELSTESSTYKTLNRNANISSAQAKQFSQNAPLYHGDQPFTEGPVYVGAIVLFFFVMGLYLTRGAFKWWIIIATLLSVMLAWGHHFMPLTNFFMDYVPGYSKFRTVSMTLVIAQFTIPVLAIIGIKKILSGTVDKATFLKALKYSLYIVGGLCLLLILVPGILQDFTATSDGRLPGWLTDALREDRKSILRQDALRSLIFILIGAGVISAFYYKKLKGNYTILLLGLFILFDLWSIDKRYLNEENFAPERKVENPFPKSKADQFILNDQEENFRVLNLSVNTFNDASTSYYHHSIGGYHGAKLQRYQDIIEYHLQPEIQNIINTLKGQNINRQEVDSILQKQDVLNMLNNKYIIYNENQAPLDNPYRLDDAWFVDEYKIVPDAMAEINALDQFNPAETAIVDKDFRENVAGKNFQKDTSGAIRLSHYEPNHLKYDFHADGEQLVIFSEIYYPKGWKLMIDGESQQLFRVNYILRAAVIPGGRHEIEMKFEPRSYYMGNKISGFSSAILLLFFITVVGYEIFRYFKAPA